MQALGTRIARRRIRELERDLRKARAETPPPSPEILDRARADGARDAERRLREYQAKVERRDRQVVTALTGVTTQVDKATSALEPIEAAIATPAMPTTRVEKRQPAPAPQPQR